MRAVVRILVWTVVRFRVIVVVVIESNLARWIEAIESHESEPHCNAWYAYDPRKKRKEKEDFLSSFAAEPRRRSRVRLEAARLLETHTIVTIDSDPLPI